MTGKFTSHWPGTMAPVSTTGPGALTSSSASTKPVIPIPKKDVRRGVRRRDRGQRPTATEDPNTKPLRRRQSRHCSRGRWPRFPHLALRPHHSRQWLRNRFSVSGPLPKKSFGEAFGAATGVSDPRLQKIRGARAKSAGRALIGHRPRTSRTSFNPCYAKPPRPLTSPSCLPFNPISSHPMSFHFRPSQHELLYFTSLNHGLIAILF